MLALMNKTERLELSISRFLGTTISSLKDPRIPLVVTVERVKLAGDGKSARVAISTLDEEQLDELVEALQHAAGYLQREMADSLSLRFVPKLRFHSNRELF